MSIKLISQTEKILARLQAEGKKIETIEWTDEQYNTWMEKMANIKRESRYKQAMSEISASKIILTS